MVVLATLSSGHSHSTSFSSLTTDIEIFSAFAPFAGPLLCFSAEHSFLLVLLEKFHLVLSPIHAGTGCMFLCRSTHKGSSTCVLKFHSVSGSPQLMIVLRDTQPRFSSRPRRKRPPRAKGASAALLEQQGLCLQTALNHETNFYLLPFV